MSLAPSARRAAEFARLLDAPQPTDDPALAPYLALATALTSLPAAPGPAPEFRTALRRRLVAVATVQQPGPIASPTERLREATSVWRVQRRLAVVAGGAAAATAIAGVGIGASRAVPGDAFYGVKRATERVQLAATFGQEAKGKRHLEFARTRLDEVRALAGGDSALGGLVGGGSLTALGVLGADAKASTILSTLQDMDAETRAGAQDLLEVAARDRAVEPLQALASFTRTQFQDLRTVLPALPNAAQARAGQSLSLLTVVASRTQAVARAAGLVPSGSTPTPTASASPAPAGSPAESPHPSRSHPAGSGPTTAPGGTSPTPAVPPLPTAVPTIPPLPLPSELPLPTVLPTSIPTQLPLLP